MMSPTFLTFNAVTFRYDSMIESLFREITLHFSSGWTGIVGPNGSGKSTLLMLATGLLTSSEGRISIPSNARYCEQRTDNPPENFDSLISSTDKTGCNLRETLGIGADWKQRWETLSHGERKRAQIAVALYENPSVLALDEPTNHVDTDTREFVAEALKHYRGIGLLVSHDRDLLNSLCSRCLFLDPPDATLYTGNYSEMAALRERERISTIRRRAIAAEQVKKLEQEFRRRCQKDDNTYNARSKRGISYRDHDAREKKDRGRATGKDAVYGKQVRQLEGRIRQAEDFRDRITVKRLPSKGIGFESSRLQKDTLFHVPPGELHLGPERMLKFPALVLRPQDRIALTGPNGSGKSSLLSHCMEALTVSGERSIYIPQEIERIMAVNTVDEILHTPLDRRGRIMTIISRLGSDPERLLHTADPSPGEIRKLILALGILNSPYLIVMDEPTNHMDIVSVECLESALEEYACALLLVSHDFRFLRRLTTIRWHIGTIAERAEVSIESWA